MTLLVAAVMLTAARRMFLRATILLGGLRVYDSRDKLDGVEDVKVSSSSLLC